MPRSAIEDCKKINGPLPSPGDFIHVQSLGEHFPAFKVTKVINTDIVDGNQEVVFTIYVEDRSGLLQSKYFDSLAEYSIEKKGSSLEKTKLKTEKWRTDPKSPLIGKGLRKYVPKFGWVNGSITAVKKYSCGKISVTGEFDGKEEELEEYEKCRKYFDMNPQPTAPIASVEAEMREANEREDTAHSELKDALEGPSDETGERASGQNKAESTKNLNRHNRRQLARTYGS